MIKSLILCLLLMLATISYADPAATQTTAMNDPLAEQIQMLQTTTQAQIDALVQQMEGLETEQKADLERQVVELKRQGEIERLNLLLEAAQAEGDAARVTELQRALEQWRNPPATRILPEIASEKDKQPSEPVPPLQSQPVSPTQSK